MSHVAYRTSRDNTCGGSDPSAPPHFSHWLRHGHSRRHLQIPVGCNFGFVFLIPLPFHCFLPSLSLVDAPTAHSVISFAVAGATIWNSLPSSPHSADLSIERFKRALKTFLFIWDHGATVTFCLRRAGYKFSDIHTYIHTDGVKCGRIMG